MHLFPSMPAAIVTGAVGMPLLIWGWKFIETTSHSQLLVLVWAIVAFIIPVVLATIDLRDVARRWRDAGFFGPAEILRRRARVYCFCTRRSKQDFRASFKLK
jgi:uncharacterized membrane protein YhaH (DUF805 family)